MVAQRGGLRAVSVFSGALLMTQYPSAGANSGNTIQLAAGGGRLNTIIPHQALSGVAESVDFAPFAVTVGVGEWAYFVAPVSFGVAAFTVSGFTGGFDVVAVVDVDGVAHNVYRSTNASLGALVVEVSHV